LAHFIAPRLPPLYDSAHKTNFLRAGIGASVTTAL
jgi:hypothetical protein